MLQFTNNEYFPALNYFRIQFNLMKNKFTVAACLSGAIAVMLGAFAAHGLKSRLSEDSLRIFHTGVEYQFYHTFALLFTGILQSGTRSTHVAGWLFLAGIILFCGSLYLLALFPLFQSIGFVTPIGGLCFIAAWISLMAGVIKTRR